MVGIYPEIKHPTYFSHEGQDRSGQPLNLNLGQLLLDVLVETGLTDPDRVVIQAFEIAPLVDLKLRQMPRAGVSFELVQLLSLPSDRSPYDVAYHQRVGADLQHLYGALAPHLQTSLSFADLVRPLMLTLLAEVYADGIGPNKDQLLPRTRPPGSFTWPPTEPATLTGEKTRLVEDAHRAGLIVHPYTLRSEPVFLAHRSDGRALTLVDEAVELLNLGVDGVFADQPDHAVAARKKVCEPTPPTH